jgi:hypothetical protein
MTPAKGPSAKAIQLDAFGYVPVTSSSLLLDCWVPRVPEFVSVKLLFKLAFYRDPFTKRPITRQLTEISNCQNLTLENVSSFHKPSRYIHSIHRIHQKE